MSNKHIWWACALKNSVCIMCWTGLAIWFDRWWIALFALFFMSTLETKKPNGYYSICDRCGRYSPEGKTRDEAEEKRIHAGWTRRNVEGHWEDTCPECHYEEQHHNLP